MVAQTGLMFLLIHQSNPRAIGELIIIYQSENDVALNF